jgi:flagellar biosynthesis/type III secretory pathway protein FliH
LYNLIKRALVTIDENEKVKLYKNESKEVKSEEISPDETEGFEAAHSNEDEIISPAVSLAKEKARVIIEEAEKEAAQLRKQALKHEAEAKRKAEQIVQNAQQGIALKEQNVEKQWRDRMNNAVVSIQKANKTFSKSKEEYIELTANMMQYILKVMVKKALCITLDEKREEVLVSKTREMMKRVMSLKEIVFKFNPADFNEFPVELKSEMKDTLPSFEIRQDRAVERGGVVVESNYGTLDGTLENQFELLDEIIRDVFGEV